MILKKWFPFVAMVAGSLCFLLLFSGAIYFSNRGFELSDEAYYLYFSQRPYSNDFLSSYFGILNNMVCFGSPDLISLRIARLLLQFFASVFFLYGLFRFLRFSGRYPNRRTRFLISVLIVLSSFISYDYMPMTLSYNSWSLILSLCAVSLLLLEFGCNSSVRQVIRSLAFGFLLFCFFLCKFPNAVFLLFVYFVFHFLLFSTGYLRKSIALIAGLASAYFLLLNDLGFLQKIASNAFGIAFNMKHAGAGSYLNDIYGLCTWLWHGGFFALQLICLLLVFVARKRQGLTLQLLMIFVPAINLLYALNFTAGNGLHLANDFIVELLFVLSGSYYWALSRFDGRQVDSAFPDYKIRIVIALLLVMPFLMMLGTSNPLYYTASHYFIYWIAAFVLLVHNGRAHSVTVLSLAALFLSICLCMILYRGMVKEPYRQSDLTLKNLPLNYTNATRNIYESYDRFSDYAAMNALMHKFNPGNGPLLSFANYFGAVIVSGSLLTPESWISDNREAVNNMKALFERSDARPDLLLMPAPVARDSLFQALFSKFKINLGTDYRLVYCYRLLSVQDTACFYKRSEARRGID